MHTPAPCAFGVFACIPFHGITFRCMFSCIYILFYFSCIVFYMFSHISHVCFIVRRIWTVLCWIIARYKSMYCYCYCYDMSSNVTMLNWKTFHDIWWHLDGGLKVIQLQISHNVNGNVNHETLSNVKSFWRGYFGKCNISEQSAGNFFLSKGFSSTWGNERLKT